MTEHKINDDLIIRLNQEMLESVCEGNWEQYQKFCHKDLTCFEAETAGHLVEGLPFHKFYFPREKENRDEVSIIASAVTVTMSRPHIRWLGEDAAVISYTRLTQRQVDGEAVTATCCETRIWERRQNQWGLVHVHRS